MLGSVVEKITGFYSENEFDLSAIKKLPGGKLELGRSCVHKEYRQGNMVSLLWAGIAKLLNCARFATYSAAEACILVTLGKSVRFTLHFQNFTGLTLSVPSILRTVFKTASMSARFYGRSLFCRSKNPGMHGEHRIGPEYLLRKETQQN